MINRDEKNELRKNKVAIKITIGDVKELRRSYVRLTKSFNEFIVDSAKESMELCDTIIIKLKELEKFNNSKSNWF